MSYIECNPPRLISDRTVKMCYNCAAAFSLKVPKGCSTELTDEGLRFITALFEKYDEVSITPIHILFIPAILEFFFLSEGVHFMPFFFDAYLRSLQQRLCSQFLSENDTRFPRSCC